MSRRAMAFVVAASVLLVFALGVLVGGRIVNRGNTPGTRSAEVGFARSMIQHHAQAVEMADIIRSRTADPQIQLLATDIVLTQQNQIGRMEALLDTWGVDATGTGQPMAWMGHTGAMPGMAARSDIELLGSSPVASAEAKFLQLMINHHKGGVDMARSVLNRNPRREIRRLAEVIVVGQQAEMESMEALSRGRPTS